MEAWIKHHREIFDDCLLINHRSTDRSLEIIKKHAPASWEVIDTQLPDFGAVELDQEMMQLEGLIDTSPETFKLCINTTEFIFTYNFRDRLEQLTHEFPDKQGFGIRSFLLQDREENLPILEPFFKNRHYGWVDGKTKPAFRHWRYIHNQPNGQYTVGRHSTTLNVINVPDLKLVHCTYVPWGPAGRKRKLQIIQDGKLPLRDIKQGYGVQHILTPERLEECYNGDLNHNVDLRKEEDFNKEYVKWIS